MEIKDYLSKWLFCIRLYYKDEFQEINNLHLVNPDFREFVKNNLTNTLYKCIKINGKYLVIHSKDYKLEILPEAIKIIMPNPKFEWGDKVQEVESPEIKGEVENIIWHMKDNEYKYYIKVNGKSKSRRYNPNELEFIKNNNG